MATNRLITFSAIEIYIGLTTNVGNTYTAGAPPVGGYTTNTLYDCTFNATNTGAATLDGYALQRNGLALTGGEIATNSDILLRFDGTHFQLMNYSTGPAGAGASYVGTTSNSGNTYTATPSPAVGSYGTGTVYVAQFNAANTGASTLNISGLGAKNVYLNGAALTGAEIAANAMIALTYDGTRFNMTGDGRGSGGGGSVTINPNIYFA
jgi:hypothetical protein